jgi:hypothetical protein
MDCLDEAQAAFETSLKLLRKRRIGSAMKLDGGEASLLRDTGNLVRILGVEDTDTLYGAGQMRCDLRNLRCRHLSLARSEDEAHGVRAPFGGKLCVVEICVGADLDPHG